MFKRLRLVLAGQFMLLSLSVYVVLAFSSLALFRHGLTEIMDERLRELADVARGTVAVNGEHLHLRGDQSAVSMVHKRISIQLWHRDRTLASAYGAPGVETFIEGESELVSGGERFRTMSSPIVLDGETVGYLQVQVDTSLRDQVVQELFDAAILLGPALILALGLTGYWFAGIAIKPVRRTYDLQKRFLSDAGHELKTPVAVIQASLEILEQDLEKQPQSLDRLKRVQRSAERMRNLVADLLLLTKTEQGSAPLEMKSLSLDMLIREVLGEFSDLYEDKGVELKAESIEAVPIEGNQQSLEIIFSNLLKNALMYTESGGSVTVGLARSGNHAVVTVADTGMGIAPADLERLFDRFFRVDESRSREDGGSGLGLAIVRAMVDNHRGSIHVESEPGKGTTFSITFPV
ncbi:MAG: sensor histidine kinase [Candidatus Obscuribacterales bacterium]